MPRYRVETNKGTFEIEANREPTAAEVETFIASGAKAVEAAPAAAKGPKTQGKAGSEATVDVPVSDFANVKPSIPQQPIQPPLPMMGGPAGMVSRLAQFLTPPAHPADRPTVGQAAQTTLRRMMAPGAVDVSAIPGTMEQNATTAANTGGDILAAARGMGIRGAGPAIGQAVGAPFAPITGSASVPVLGAIGGVGSEALAQFLEGGKMRPGAIMAAGAMGAIPGSPLAGATMRQVGKQAFTQGAANLGAQALATGIDEGRLPTAREAFLSGGLGAAAPVVGKTLDAGAKAAKRAAEKLRATIPNEHVTAGLEAGYVATPDAVAHAFKKDSDAIGSTLQSVGGLAAVNAEANLRNQRVTNELGALALGLPKNTPLRRTTYVDLPSGGTQKIPGTTEQVRAAASKPYKEIEAISDRAAKDLEVLERGNKLTATNQHELNILNADPATVKKRAELEVKAGADVRKLSLLRQQAKEKFDVANTSAHGDPKALREARDLWDEAEKLEDAIQKGAEAAGRPELAGQLAEARKKISRSYAVENALDPNGDISAPILGRMLDAGVPLTGELKTIAEYERSMGKVMREAQKAASPSSTALRAGLAVGGGLMGAAAHDYPLMVAGALTPFIAQRAAKAAIFSGPYQRSLSPATMGGPSMPDTMSEIARFTTASAGREPNSFLEFLKEKYPRNKPVAMNFDAQMPRVPTALIAPSPETPAGASQPETPSPEPAPEEPAPEERPKKKTAFREGRIYRSGGKRARYTKGEFVPV